MREWRTSSRLYGYGPPALLPGLADTVRRDSDLAEGKQATVTQNVVSAYPVSDSESVQGAEWSLSESEAPSGEARGALDAFLGAFLREAAATAGSTEAYGAPEDDAASGRTAAVLGFRRRLPRCTSVDSVAWR